MLSIYFTSLVNTFLTLTGCFIGGGILSIILIGNLYPSMLKKYKKPIKLTMYDKIKKYELKYYDEFDKLEDVEYNKDDLLNKNFKDVTENTPFGKILMKYNIDYETFWYYSEKKHIPYKILDTVARKFTIENNCKSICINYKKEYNIKKDLLKSNEENKNNKNNEKNKDNEENKNNKKTKKDVYIKLKSYNEKNNKKDKQNNINTILLDKTNRFTYKGSIDEYYYKPPKENIVELSYKDYIINNK